MTIKTITNLLVFVFMLISSSVIATEINPKFSLKVNFNDEAKVGIVVTTNLPEKMMFNVTIIDKDQIKSYGSTDASVENEKIIILPFTSNLSNGEYTVQLLSTFTQPESVKAIIGKRGENLIGPHIDNFIGKSIEYSHSFTVDIKGNKKYTLSNDLKIELGKLRKHYKELIKFKSNPSFIEWGFALGNPDKTYSNWLKFAQKSDKNIDKTINIKIVSMKKVNWSYLILLSRSYMRSKGKETKFNREYKALFDAI